MQKSEVERSEDPEQFRGQKSEVRSQKSEVRSQKSEVRSQKSEVRSQKIIDLKFRYFNSKFKSRN
ncbi:MAG: hypothetical protein J0L62_16115 [Bacteroidetes bacterium]|nr:hypothetical protein [Bacteroidota bacterium]